MLYLRHSTFYLFIMIHFHSVNQQLRAVWDLLKVIIACIYIWICLLLRCLSLLEKTRYIRKLSEVPLHLGAVSRLCWGVCQGLEQPVTFQTAASSHLFSFNLACEDFAEGFLTPTSSSTSLSLSLSLSLHAHDTSNTHLFAHISYHTIKHKAFSNILPTVCMQPRASQIPAL